MVADEVGRMRDSTRGFDGPLGLTPQKRTRTTMDGPGRWLDNVSIE